MNQRTCFKASLRTFALALLLAVPAAAPAQTPAAFPQLDVATTPSTQLLTGIALDGQGSLTLVGTQLASAGESALGRRFSAADVPLGPDFVLAPVPSSSGEAAANMSGATVLSWSRPRPGGGTDVVVRRISPTLGTGNFVANGPGAVRRGPGDVAISRSGNFVAVWDADNAIFGQRFNADGTKRGPELRAAPISSRLRSEEHTSASHANISYAVFCLKKKKKNLVETLHRVGIKLDLECPHGAVDLLDRAWADDVRGDHRVAEEPRERNVGRRVTELGAELLPLRELRAHGLDAILDVLVAATTTGGAVGEHAAEQPTTERAPRDHADAVV